MAITADTITVRRAETATATAVHFYDVPLRLVEMTRHPTFGAPTTGDFPPGAYVSATVPAKDANDMVLTGWICTEGGSPGQWEPVYLSSVSPAG